MADKLNIQFRIKAVDAFSATMNKMERKLDQLKAKGDKFDITTTLNIDIDDAGFEAAIDKANAKAKELEEAVSTSVKVEGVKKFLGQMKRVKDSIPHSRTVTITVRTKTVHDKDLDKIPEKLAALQRRVDALSGGGGDVDVDVNANTRDYDRDIDRVNRTNDDLRNQPVKVILKAAVNDFRNTMGRITSFSRNVGELMRHYLVGGLVNALPMLVPAIASIGAALGALLPIVGVLGAGIMGLGTSFGLAGAAAVAYGVLAAGALGDVFDASKKLRAMQENLNNTTDEEERAKIIEEMAGVTGALSKEQLGALGALNKTKDVWGGISKALEPQIVTTFGSAMGGLTTILTALTPMFASVVKHADNLVNAFNLNIDTADFQAFLGLMNTQAGPAFETIGKAIGNFAMGIVNLMTAFGPASADMSKGFLGMSKSFREWTASLADSEKFNAFIDYAKENLPKLADIFGSLIDGLVSMGEAFAPFASDMLTGLQDMMNRFQEWSESLKTNDGFQKFIDYVVANGPVLLSFIGEFVDFIINLGEALAPAGAAMLNFSDMMFGLVNSFMDANPEFMKIIASFLVFFGILITHIPTFLLFRSLFTTLSPLFAKLTPWLITMGAKFKLLGGQIMSLISPITNVALKIVNLGKGAFGTLIKWVLKVLPHVAKIGLTIGRLGTPIGIIITIVTLLATVIYNNWDSIWSYTKKIFGALISFFSTVGGKILAPITALGKSIIGYFDGLSLTESGKKIIGSVIKGINSMGKGITKAVKGIAQKIRDFFPFSPAKTGPLSDLNKLNFKGPVIDSLERDLPDIARAMNDGLALPDVTAGGFSAGTYAARSTGFAASGATQEARTVDAILNGLVIESSDVVMSGEKVGKITWKAAERYSQRDKEMKTKLVGG